MSVYNVYSYIHSQIDNLNNSIAKCLVLQLVSNLLYIKFCCCSVKKRAQDCYENLFMVENRIEKTIIIVNTCHTLSINKYNFYYLYIILLLYVLIASKPETCSHSNHVYSMIMKMFKQLAFGRSVYAQQRCCLNDSRHCVQKIQLLGKVVCKSVSFAYTCYLKQSEKKFLMLLRYYESLYSKVHCTLHY